MEKGVFWKSGLLRKVLVLEALENLDILEILERENPQILENRGESNHFLPKNPENLDSIEILWGQGGESWIFPFFFLDFPFHGGSLAL